MTEQKFVQSLSVILPLGTLILHLRYFLKKHTTTAIIENENKGNK